MSVNRDSASSLRKDELPYTTVCNDTINLIRNTDALAVWSYLQTKPAGWIVRSKDIQRHFEIGRDKYRNAMKYLVGIGLITYEHHQDEAGRMQGTSIHVHNRPAERLNTRLPENPPIGKPDPLVIEGGVSNVLNDRKVVQNDVLNDTGPHDDLFNKFWNAGLRKDGKKPAKEKFLRLLKRESDPEAFTERLVADIELRLEAGVPGFDKIHPKTYLNQFRWLDDAPERCPHAALLTAWNEELPEHIEKLSAEDWTPDSRGFQALTNAWQNFKTKPRTGTGKPVFTEEQAGIDFYREVFRRLAKLSRVQEESAARWCRLSWAAQQQVTVQIYKGEIQ